MQSAYIAERLFPGTSPNILPICELQVLLGKIIFLVSFSSFRPEMNALNIYLTVCYVLLHLICMI